MLSFYLVLPAPNYRPVVFSCATLFSLFCASSPYDSSAALLFAPSKLKPSCSHHPQDTHTPGLQEDHSQRSIIGHVAIYCLAVFCLLVTYVSIYSKPASYISTASRGYSQLPPLSLLICLLVIRSATLSWKILRARSTLGSGPMSQPWTATLPELPPWRSEPIPSGPPPPGSKSANPPPTLPRLLYVAFHFRPVAISRRHHTTHILERRKSL